jgi:hypothetical protein
MPEFKGNNDLKARDMLIQRSIYTAYALTLLETIDSPTIETIQIKDFQKDEKLFVGRVDRNMNPVFVNNTQLKAVRGTNGKLLVNFVADAFDDMKTKYESALRTGKISMLSDKLGTMNIQKAYVKPEDSYRNHLSVISTKFRDYAKRTGVSSEILDFNSFIKPFMAYIETVARRNPITRSMYFLTNNISVLSSGLAFEIGVGDYGNDEQKANLYYRDKNFEYLKNLAYLHGFVIDKHIPWRLVADVNSPQMKRYIRKRLKIDGGSGPVFKLVFTTTYLDDIPMIINIMVESFNALVRHRPQVIIKETSATTNSSGKTIFNNCRNVKRITRATVTSAEIRDQYGDDFWLDIYTRIRNIETGIGYSENTINVISKSAVDLNKALDNSSAMRYIISKFNNVEHFQGSLFYDITRIELSAESSIDEEEVDKIVKRSVQASNFIIY